MKTTNEIRSVNAGKENENVIDATMETGTLMLITAGVSLLVIVAYTLFKMVVG